MAIAMVVIALLSIQLLFLWMAWDTGYDCGWEDAHNEFQSIIDNAREDFC